MGITGLMGRGKAVHIIMSRVVGSRLLAMPSIMERTCVLDPSSVRSAMRRRLHT